MTSTVCNFLICHMTDCNWQIVVWWHMSHIVRPDRHNKQVPIPNSSLFDILVYIKVAQTLSVASKEVPNLTNLQSFVRSSKGIIFFTRATKYTTTSEPKIKLWKWNICFWSSRSVLTYSNISNDSYFMTH